MENMENKENEQINDLNISQCEGFFRSAFKIGVGVNPNYMHSITGANGGMLMYYDNTPQEVISNFLEKERKDFEIRKCNERKKIAKDLLDNTPFYQFKQIRVIKDFIEAKF